MNVIVKLKITVLILLVQWIVVGCSNQTQTQKEGIAKNSFSDYTICFQSTRAKPAQLFTINENGEELRQITNGTGPASFPIFLRKKNQIIYTFSPSKTKTTINMLDLDDSKIKQICEINGDGVVFDLTHDEKCGLLLSIQPDKKIGNVYLLNLTNGNKRLISPPGANLFQPMLSKDGRSMFANLILDDRTEIVKIDLESKKIQKIPHLPINANLLGFDSLSGRLLYLIQGAKSSNGLWLADEFNQTTEKLRIFAESSKYGIWTTFSPDGKYIFFSAGKQSKIYRYDLDSRITKQITFGDGQDFAPTVRKH